MPAPRYLRGVPPADAPEPGLSSAAGEGVLLLCRPPAGDAPARHCGCRLLTLAVCTLRRTFDDVEVADISLEDYIAVKVRRAATALLSLLPKRVSARSLCSAGREAVDASTHSGSVCFFRLQHKYATYLPHTAGRYQTRRFRKATVRSQTISSFGWNICARQYGSVWQARAKRGG